MSAAEKLKALPVPFDLSEGHSTMLVLVDALPQIVAVVEAAEQFTAAVDYSLAQGFTPALSEATAERVRLDELLRFALAALDETLS